AVPNVRAKQTIDKPRISRRADLSRQPLQAVVEPQPAVGDGVNLRWKRNMVVVRSLAPARPRVQQQVSVGVEGGGAKGNLVIYPTDERGREMNFQRWAISGSIGFGISVLASAAFAQSGPCSGVPTW